MELRREARSEQQTGKYTRPEMIIPTSRTLRLARAVARGASPLRRSHRSPLAPPCIGADPVGNQNQPPMTSLSRATKRGSALLFVLLLGSACGEAPAGRAELTPRVKVFEVGKQATGQTRRISGRVEAAEQTSLSFGVGGQVLEIVVDEGQMVAEGQLLARLDDEPLRLKAQEARAGLNNARARLVEAQTSFERVKGLVESRAAAQKDLDSATSRFSTADGDVKAAKSQLERAERDLSRALLTAPYSGTIASVSVDPFQDILAKDPVLVLQGDSSLEVDLLVPETIIRFVSFGQVVHVSFPTLPGVDASGTLTQIGASAQAGNAFPVTVALEPGSADLRPGMTASVTFNFSSYLDGKVAYLLPISALAIEGAIADSLEQEGEGDPFAPNEQGKRELAPIFVLSDGALEFRKVRIGGLQGNEVQVLEGLEAGEQVVTAGVAFLRDGMKAEAWTQR